MYDYYFILIIFCFIGYLLYYNYTQATEKYLIEKQKSSASSSSSSIEITIPNFHDIVEDVNYPEIVVQVTGQKVRVEYNNLQEFLSSHGLQEYSFVDILKNMAKRHVSKYIPDKDKANIRRKVANMMQKIGETLIDGFITSIMKKFKEESTSEKYSDMEIKDIVSKLNEECKFL